MLQTGKIRGMKDQIGVDPAFPHQEKETSFLGKAPDRGREISFVIGLIGDR